MEQLKNLMKQHLSPERQEKIEAISRDRTRYISVVLEDVYYTQNISAVVRTCECQGIQNLHIIGGDHSSKVNKHVSLGAANWVTIHREYGRPKDDALRDLKQQGYRLLATTLSGGAIPVSEVDIQAGKIAVIMGSELEGISSTVKELADEFITIPMYGFSDSYNISVSAAIILYQFTQKLRNSGIDWRLSPDELLELKYQWIKASIKRGDQVEREYIARLAHPNDQAERPPRKTPKRQRGRQPEHKTLTIP